MRRYSSVQSDGNVPAGYDHIHIEDKWKKRWVENRTHKKNRTKSEKGQKYILSMFPYPSGVLHMGHARVYTISDVLSRYHKLLGYDVLHPMGWDAFGLPAENAAIERGISPSEWTYSNIEDMRSQFYQFGVDFDWEDTEVFTCNPDYYKWTQWLFLELYKHGLAYQKYSYVNWDPVDKTVLANEQVDAEGRSWRSGAIVEKKKLKQWYFKLTHFGESLINDLDTLTDWPSNVLAMQREWIGKKQGTLFNFKIYGTEQNLEVFTTRPDTIYGVTYLVLSPENPLASEIVDENHLQTFKSFKEKTINTRDIDRQHSKVGVPLGAWAVHPLNGEKIPIFVAEYVLPDFGTGAVMGVPAHDTRDYEFAQTNSLPCIQVIQSDEPCFTGDGILKNSGIFNGLNSLEMRKNISSYELLNPFSKPHSFFTVRDWLISRQRYWGAPIPMIHCDSCGSVPVPDEQLPVSLPPNPTFSKTGHKVTDDWLKTECPSCGGKAIRDTDTMDTFVDSSWYFMRYPDAKNNQEIFKKNVIQESFPVDIYIGGIEHAILHLLYSRFITKFMHSAGYLPENEPFKKLVTQGMVHGKTFKMPDSQRCVRIEEVEEKGDKAYLKNTEKELVISWEKMSKSKYNGINPQDIIKEFGSDTMRLFLLFKAPVDSVLDWDTNAIRGQYRWINRIVKLVQDLLALKSSGKVSKRHIPELSDYTNTIVIDVSKDMGNLQFNTSIAHLMKLSNKLKEYNGDEEILSADYEKSLKKLLLMLFPMAPHISAELLESMQGQPLDIKSLSWPSFQEKMSHLMKKLIVNVNGKVKGSISVEDLIDEQSLLNSIKQSKFSKFITEDYSIERYPKADVISFKK